LYINSSEKEHENPPPLIASGNLSHPLGDFFKECSGPNWAQLGLPLVKLMEVSLGYTPYYSSAWLILRRY